MSKRVGMTRWYIGVLATMLVAGLTHAADKAPAKESTGSGAPIPKEAWAKASTTPLTSKQLDELIDGYLTKEGIKATPRISDDQFIRRATLDLTGQLPTPKQVADFVANKDENKRTKLVDELLDSREYARYWSRYWRQVISVKLVGNFQGQLLARPFETWMTDQLKENKSWADIMTAMLTAEGEVKFDDDGKKGAHYFLGAHQGADAVVEQASETSRIFLGIQIQCAQCHDHPFDVWKREQFHTFAAYFARVRPQLMRDPDSTNVRFIGVNLAPSRFGEHRMPDKDNPRAGKTMMPEFLDGKGVSGRDTGDSARRQALVKSILSEDNPWFSAAYVNRMWGMLMGQSFYMPIDDMGPQKEAVMGEVLTRVAAGFRGSKYDIKGFYRLVLNSEAYQRQIRPGESGTDHLQFAALYPTRLPADALWNALNGVLGPIDRGGFGGGRPMPGGGGGFGGRGGFGGLERSFKAEFAYDPSLKPEDVEGSVAMALLMMNNPQLQSKLEARGDNILAKILRDNSKNEDAINALYVQVLSRKPTDKERDKCIKYIAKNGKRDEAFEDILWALVNSTEFQTRR